MADDIKSVKPIVAKSDGLCILKIFGLGYRGVAIIHLYIEHYGKKAFASSFGRQDNGASGRERR